MSARRSLVAALLGFAFAAKAQAGVTSYEPGHLRCDVKAGDYNQTEIGAYSHPNELAARMRLLSDQSHPVWVGSAGLLFEYTGKRWAGVTVSTMPSDKEYLYVRAIDMGPGRRWRQVDVARVARNQWVSVRAVLDQKGYLAVTTGNYSKRIKIGPRPVVRSVVHCQSSSFEIDLRPPQ